MTVHTVGALGLILAFVIGTLRPIDLGTLGFVLTFLVGAFVAHETPREMYVTSQASRTCSVSRTPTAPWHASWKRWPASSGVGAC